MQKLPFEWREAAEMMTLSSTKLFLMNDFIEDMSARLTGEIDGMKCEGIFLKAGTIKLERGDARRESGSEASTRSSNQPKVLPVVRECVRDEFRA